MSSISRPRPSSLEMLLLRDRLGLGRFRKTAVRDDEKRSLLLKLGLDRISKAEQDNFISLGSRKRRVRSSAFIII